MRPREKRPALKPWTLDSDVAFGLMLRVWEAWARRAIGGDGWRAREEALLHFGDAVESGFLCHSVTLNESGQRVAADAFERAPKVDGKGLALPRIEPGSLATDVAFGLMLAVWNAWRGTGDIESQQDIAIEDFGNHALAAELHDGLYLTVTGRALVERALAEASQ